MNEETQAGSGLSDQLDRANESELRAKYHELIYAVGNRYLNETRHQTALRYIREAESHDPAQAPETKDAQAV